MFIQVPVHDSVLSVRDQVCLGTQTPGTNYHLTDDFGALDDLHPLWGTQLAAYLGNLWEFVTSSVSVLGLIVVRYSAKRAQKRNFQMY